MSMRSPKIKPENSLSIRNCVEKKLNAFKHFYSATLAIKKYIDAGEVDKIDNFIQERQRCMDIIDRIDDYILKIPHDSHAYVSFLTDEIRAHIEKVLVEISTLDKECHVVAASRLDTLQQEILQAIRNGHDVQRYPAAIPQTPRFLDIQL